MLILVRGFVKKEVDKVASAVGLGMAQNYQDVISSEEFFRSPEVMQDRQHTLISLEYEDILARFSLTNRNRTLAYAVNLSRKMDNLFIAKAMLGINVDKRIDLVKDVEVEVK